MNQGMSELSKRLLSTLLVLGANSPEKALTIEEVATKLGMHRSTIEPELRALVEAGYARQDEIRGSFRVCLTGTGIITASSTYS